LKNLPRMQHQAEYFMDYDAMLRRDLVYDDWSDKATIVNAPFHVVHPMLYYSAFAFGLLLISFATWFVFRLHFLMQHQRKDKVLSSLRQQIERRNQLLKAASCTNWILKDGFISFHEDFANQWSPKLRKISVTDFIGMVHADMQAEFAEFIAKRDKYLNQMAISLSFDEGKSWHMFEINYKAVTKKDGKEMVLGLMINMDMQKQVDDQLLHAQEAAEFVEMKEMFLANMNHDIRTPLSAISGFSELITEMGDELDDETFQSYTQIISQNSQMLLKLVDDVLNMRGNDLGKFCFYPKEISVDEFMTQAYKTNQVLCPQHLEFKFVKGREGLAFYVDYERTMQVINNFLSNAFKYTQKGSVTLGWQHVAATDEVELYVADTGVGISKEDQIKLFDRFYMTDSNSKKGTGLGLNISKTLVEDQQGRVEVNSVLGAGSRFAAIFKVCRLLLLSLGLGLSSCGELGLQQHPDGRDYKVAVIHSYDTLLEDYQTFEEVLDEEFREEGLSVQQSTFYLDLADVEPKSPKVQQTLESLVSLKPDVVLIDDDLAIQSVLKAGSSYLQEVPIVVGGWTMPDWNYKYHYPLMTGWESPIDYPRNLEMAKEFIDINLVEVELDHTYIDSLRREDLSKGIARPPFVDNSDLHQRELGWVALKEGALKDSIVVMVVSVRTPERNVEKVPHPEYPITDP
ncbi:MAG: HAMP domain-containing histidine kinase, partial [Bacteroidaceae bacterium]|nr:HAMP domain-containing histidine kinase [Bacteroidaceae bacterium]